MKYVKLPRRPRQAAAPKPDPLPDAVARHCEFCGTVLVRKRRTRGLEPLDKWEERRFCDYACASQGRNPRTSKAQYDSITWAPIVCGPPTNDRCWAGHLAGNRCVLNRGGHVTHRDADGREFVRAERKPVAPFERNTDTSSVREYLTLRSEWRQTRSR